MAELPSGTVTFLFTDIEGSTRLLQQLGSGYGEALREHERLLRQAFSDHSGEVVDTQGDAFFAVFPRARNAVEAAVAAQRSLAAHRWPDGKTLRVRMGLHTGEPSVTEGRYLGLDVHRASRICSAGHGGQALLSQTTGALVGGDLPPGVGLKDLGEQNLKDLERPERLFQLEIDGLPQQFPPLRTAEAEADPFGGRAGELAEAAQAAVAARVRRTRLLAGGAVLVAAAALAALGLLLLRGGSSVKVVPDSVAAIDPGSNKIVRDVPAGAMAGPVAAGKRFVWVAAEDHTLTRVDTSTAERRTVPLVATPTGIAVGNGAIWVAFGLLGSLARVDPQFLNVDRTIQIAGRSTGGTVAAGSGAVWVAFGDSTVARVDPATLVVRTAPNAQGRPSAVAIEPQAVWIANREHNSVSRISPQTNQAVAEITVGTGPSGLAIGAGAVWVTNSQDDTVSRIDPTSNSVPTTISVGDDPTGIAFGAGSVWVANTKGRTISRIDPAANRVVATIKAGESPQELTYAGGRLWVSVQAG